MKASLLKMGLWACLVVGALWAAGCVDNDKSLTIAFATWPEPETCGVTVQDGSDFEYIGQGVLDLDYAGFNNEPVYFLTMQMSNNLQYNPETDVDANSIQIEHFRVTYRWVRGRESLEGTANGAQLLLLEDMEHIEPYAVVVGAGDEGDPGRLAVIFQALPRELGRTLTNLPTDSLDTYVLGLDVQAVGSTLAESRIESNHFMFPVKFCRGCLDCGALPNVSCFPGQDPLYCETGT